MRIKIVIALILVSFSSCVKDVDYKLDFEGSKLVVIANGQANNNLTAFVTQTFKPLTQIDNPDSLLINDAFIEIFENSILVDTMVLVENGKYKSNMTLKENHEYQIRVKSDGLGKVVSQSDTVSLPAKLINASIINIYPEKDTTLSYKIYLDIDLVIKKSTLFPYNNLTINYFFNGITQEDYLFLSSKSDFIECDNCFNLLDNPCTINKGNGLYEIKTQIILYRPDFVLDELDSVQFVLETYSSLAEKLCQAGIDLEEYYNNPLPFSSNPPADFSNIEGGYGLFLLNSVDSATVKLK
ncbi:MAG TPA: DUF4249 family protein [Bacteroidetes bacterium]|nr:DUF4249 family protein [Bacteroidota bacterium]